MNTLFEVGINVQANQRCTIISNGQSVPYVNINYYTTHHVFAVNADDAIIVAKERSTEALYTQYKLTIHADVKLSTLYVHRVVA